MGRLVACSARITAGIQTDRHTRRASTVTLAAHARRGLISINSLRAHIQLFVCSKPHNSNMPFVPHARMICSGTTIFWSSWLLVFFSHYSDSVRSCMSWTRCHNYASQNVLFFVPVIKTRIRQVCKLLPLTTIKLKLIIISYGHSYTCSHSPLLLLLQSQFTTVILGVSAIIKTTKRTKLLDAILLTSQHLCCLHPAICVVS